MDINILDFLKNLIIGNPSQGTFGLLFGENRFYTYFCMNTIKNCHKIIHLDLLSCWFTIEIKMIICIIQTITNFTMIKL